MSLINSEHIKRLKIGDQATYRISVQGCLDDIWSDRLADMTITMNIVEGRPPVSTLVGSLKDQAELIGVLNGLYELRMPVLSLELLEESENENK